MVNRLRIAIDMDEVLADTLTAELAWLDGEWGCKLSKAMLAGRELRDVLDPAVYASHQSHLDGGAFFAELPLMPGSLPAVEEIASRHEVFVVSAATEYPASCPYKFTWIRRHFTFIPPERIVFCGDKSILAADILVDDHSRHFRRFSGQGMLFSAPHNLKIEGWPRLQDWEEARKVLLDPALRRSISSPEPRV